LVKNPKNNPIGDEKNNYRKRSDKRRWIKLLTILIIIIILFSAILNLYFIYAAARSLDVKPKRVESVKLISLENYEISFILTLNNPTNTELRIDQVTYDVHIENDYLGSGIRKDLTIGPGSSDHSFSFHFNIFDLSTVVRNQLLSLSITIYISGSVTVPIKLFNILKVSEVTVDYELTEDVSVI
jgi:hypothetical protein